MSKYKKFKERQKTATPDANHAVCKKCIYFEFVRINGYCSGFGRPRKIPQSIVWTDKESYCSRFKPKGSELKGL